MRHSIVTWDSTYRHFFHLVDGLLHQEYDRDEFELIYIEQRSREHANEYTHAEGVASLEDRYEEVPDDFKFRIHYMEEDLSTPYHLGRILNAGIERAEGEYVSIMDGDQLLPSDFLSKLDKFFESGGRIANAIRRIAREPVGVSKENWHDAKIKFEECLEKCPNKGDPFPNETPNYGPLLSAHRSDWAAVNSYSTHPVWQSTMNRCHTDTNRRLEIHTGEQSQLLPDTVLVHPWHPPPPNRMLYKYRKLFSIQERIIQWTEEHQEHDWKRRRSFANSVYCDNERFFDRVMKSPDLAVPGKAAQDERSQIDVVREEISMMVALAVFESPYRTAEHVGNLVKRGINKVVPVNLNVNESR